MDTPTKVTLKPESNVFTAVQWHPERDAHGAVIHGRSLGGIQASHGQGLVLYVDVKGKRMEVFDGDFIVYKNGGLEEVLKPEEFFAKYDGIANPKDQPAPAKDWEVGGVPRREPVSLDPYQGAETSREPANREEAKPLTIPLS